MKNNEENLEKFKATIKYIHLSINNKDEACSFLSSFSDEDKIDIIHAVKYILAKIQIEKGVNMRNACYDCKYRNSVPGSAHSYCSNPVALAIGDEYGIKSGWFFHPLNFDPTWLRYCDGFEKEKQD